MVKPLNEKEWKGSNLDSFATVNSGRDIYAQERIEGDTPYVTSGIANNGIGYFVSNNNNSKTKNSISVNRNGAVGEAFYHPYIALYGNDCRRVNLREVDDEATQLFIARCISSQKSAFGYGRKLGTARLKKLHVMLPVTEDGDPDYGYMSNYVREHKEAMLAKYRNYAEKRITEIGDYIEIPALEEKKWEPYKMDDLFDSIEATKGRTTGQLIKGDDVPYIAAAKMNNGYAGMCSSMKCPEWVSKGNTIVFVQLGDGAAGLAHYIPMNFIGMSGKTSCGYFNKMNKYIGVFLTRCLSVNKGKFSHGYSWTGKRLKNTKVMLPIDNMETPDFEYMEQYGKNMMLRKYKQYLHFLDKKYKLHM